MSGEFITRMMPIAETVAAERRPGSLFRAAQWQADGNWLVIQTADGKIGIGSARWLWLAKWRASRAR